MSEETTQQAGGTAPVMKVGEWIVTFILTAIPLVGIIMLFVWAFGSGANPNKKNFAKAALVLYAIFFVLYLILMIFGLAVS